MPRDDERLRDPVLSDTGAMISGGRVGILFNESWRRVFDMNRTLFDRESDRFSECAGLPAL
jgi:hypothetical protein